MNSEVIFQPKAFYDSSLWFCSVILYLHIYICIRKKQSVS